MSASSAAPANLMPSDPASRGTLAFKGLWLFSPRADATFLILPLALTALAAAFSSLGDVAKSHGLAVWTAQNILGNGTHVILTFLLFAVHRDVLTADPKQPKLVLLGCLLTLGVGLAFFGLYYVNRDVHIYAMTVMFNILGLHHTLSQHRGFWSLHGLRAYQAGLGPSSPRERPLQQVYVPLMLSLVLVRLFFIPDSDAVDATPYIDVGQGAVLPHGALGLLIAVWLGYFAMVFHTVLSTGVASGPKVLYLFVVAIATGLVMVAPAWSNVVLPGLHGVEYYLLTARMLEPREGDAPSRFKRSWIWPAMILSMLPLAALGLVDLFAEDNVGGTLRTANIDKPLINPFLHGAICLSLAVVLAHYFADALIYRFRIPSIRNVMLRRLGFAVPGAPRAAPAASASPAPAPATAQ
ncbi:hypothetical protein P2318_11175 [Myxococcaceae bacterium GXIMD 01537]